MFCFRTKLGNSSMLNIQEEVYLFSSPISKRQKIDLWKGSLNEDMVFSIMLNNMPTVCPFFWNKMSINIYCFFVVQILYIKRCNRWSAWRRFKFYPTALGNKVRKSLGIFLCVFLNLVSATDWFIQWLYFMGMLVQGWTQSLMTGNAVNVACLSYKSFQHVVWFFLCLSDAEEDFCDRRK